MGIANKKDGEESSGLYDLKELATSAKKRRTQRLSSEMEAQQSLLQSSAALEAVALPDPKKSQEIAIPSIAMDTVSGANTTKVKSVATSASTATATQLPEERASSSKGWLLAGVALVAVAGAAAAFFLTQDKGSATPSAALAQAGESEVPTPVQALPAVAEDQEEADADAVQVEALAAEETTETEADVGEEAAVEGDSQELAAKDQAPTHTDKDTDTDKDKEKAKPAANDDTKVAAKNKSAEADDKAKVEKAEVKEVAPKQEEPAKLDSSASVDDILSSVTGGVEKQEVAAEEKAPSKKQLERGDIAKAMKKISPQAKACYAEEEFSGVVTVKYSVEPDGSVSGAKATGAHGSSKTGACVVKAVNAANFPPFSGAATSFSFPFLLSP